MFGAPKLFPLKLPPHSRYVYEHGWVVGYDVGSIDGTGLGCGVGSIDGCGEGGSDGAPVGAW